MVNSYEITYGSSIHVFSCYTTVLDFIQIMNNMWAKRIVFLSFYLVSLEQKVVQNW